MIKNKTNKEKTILSVSPYSIIFDLTENHKPVPPKNYTCEGNCGYKYSNDLLMFCTQKNIFFPFRRFVSDIAVKNGQVTFYLEDAEPFCIKNRFLTENFCDDTKGPVPILGRDSVLKHYFKDVHTTDCSRYWPNEVASYTANNITECIHDGVTSFIFHYNGKGDDTPTYFVFPDGAYDLDGVRLADDVKKDFFLYDEIPF